MAAAGDEIGMRVCVCGRGDGYGGSQGCGVCVGEGGGGGVTLYVYLFGRCHAVCAVCVLHVILSVYILLCLSVCVVFYSVGLSVYCCQCTALCVCAVCVLHFILHCLYPRACAVCVLLFFLFPCVCILFCLSAFFSVCVVLSGYCIMHQMV
jgi:hypothetical protein